MASRGKTDARRSPPAKTRAAVRDWSPARPLLKWVGGKRQLVPQILELLPRSIETYYEPFAGGAAVFFTLAREGRFERAVLADSNAELIETYRTVRDDVEAVIRSLRRMKHSEEDYYRLRAEQPTRPARRAARMIYLNRTGFNGLYRVNSSGQFNVPFGRYDKLVICDPEHLRSISKMLQGVELHVSDFEAVVADAKPGDAVYFDPPYVPLSKTANFASYQKGGFDEQEHERLAQVFTQLDQQGIHVLLSNSHTPLTKRLYEQHRTRAVLARRMVNSNSQGRGAIKELLVQGRSRKED